MNSFSFKSVASSFDGESLDILRVTDDPIVNGEELINHYNNIIVTPNENGKTIMIPPGEYNLNGQCLNLWKPKVDLVGVGETPGQQKIYSDVPNGAVVNIMSNRISLKNLNIKNTYKKYVNPTPQQYDESVYNKTSSIRDYGFYAPAALYYQHSFVLRTFNELANQEEQTFFINLNTKAYLNDPDILHIFPQEWNLNIFNTRLYKSVTGNMYFALFEKPSEDIPLGWYFFSKTETSPYIEIFARGLDVDATFPWECKTWRTPTSPFTYFDFEFTLWPYEVDFINLENVHLEDSDWALSMVSSSAYFGNFKNVKAGVYSFGGMDGFAAGKYENCVGSMYSFGQPWDLQRNEKHLHLSGEFINCMADFGSFGQKGLIAGIFKNCKQKHYKTQNVGDFSNVEFGNLTGEGSMIIDSFSFGTGSIEDSFPIIDNRPITSQIIWNETNSGDLSNNPFNPTHLGTLLSSESSNIIHIIQTNTQNIDTEYFALNLPENKMITGVILKSYQNNDEFSANATLSIKTGEVWDAGNNLGLMIGQAVFSENDIALNLLSKMENVSSISSSPLTFKMQYAGGPTDIELQIELN